MKVYLVKHKAPFYQHKKLLQPANAILAFPRKKDASAWIEVAKDWARRNYESIDHVEFEILTAEIQ